VKHLSSFEQKIKRDCISSGERKFKRSFRKTVYSRSCLNDKITDGVNPV